MTAETRADGLLAYRVWLRRGDVCWWEPVDASNAQEALKKTSRAKRKLVTKIVPIPGGPRE